MQHGPSSWTPGVPSTSAHRLRDTGSEMTSVARQLVLLGQVISHQQYRMSSYDSKPVFKDIAKLHVE